MLGTKLLLLATVAPAHALLAAAPAIRSVARAPVVRMDDWRPTNVDPLGQAMGMPREIERPYSYWLDLRTSEITFAQMVVYKLFYAVRRVVDEAGKALPKGAGVQGLLFDGARYDRADTLGQDLPIFVEQVAGSGVVNNATLSGQEDAVPTALRTVSTLEELCAAQAELEQAAADAPGEATRAIALPADAMLWAVALTGVEECQLEALEANAGA